MFLASIDTSERSLGPRDCGALRGVLGTRKRVKTRSGEPREHGLDLITEVIRNTIKPAAATYYLNIYNVCFYQLL